MSSGELLIFGISEMIYVYCIFSYFELFLGQARLTQRTVLFTASLIWFIEMLMLVLDVTPSLVFIMNIFMFSSIAFYVYGGSFRKILLSMFLLFSFLVSTDILAFLVFQRTGTKLAYVFLLSVLWILTWINFIRKYIDTRWKELPSKYFLVFVLSPLMSILCLLYNYLYKANQMSYYYFDSFLLTLLFINMSLLFLYEGMGKYIEETREKEAIKGQRDSLEKLLEERQKSQKETSKFRHEYINQVEMLAYCLEEGKVDLAKERLEDLSSQLKKTSVPIRLGDPLLDRLIEGKIEELRDLEADIHLDLEILAHIGNLNFPLYTILENTIKNAIEALEGTEDKFFSLEVSKDREIHIVIKNSFSKRPLFKGGRYIRYDRNPNRGLGLSIVQAEVDKLRGKMDISIEGIIFIVDIKIPVKTSQGQ